jgi:hypothetical protein
MKFVGYMLFVLTLTMCRSCAHEREIFVKNASFLSWLCEGPIRRTIEGGVNGSCSQRRWELQQDKDSFQHTSLTHYLLTDKRCIPLRSASVRTYTFSTTGFPRFLSIRRARGLQAFDLHLLTNYSNPNYY